MYSIIIGSIVLSLLHAVIPSHWLPVIAIGKKEGWSTTEVVQVTLLSGLAHVLSTVLIGFVLGYVGVELSFHVESFSRLIAPTILVLLGLFFLWQHHRHRHFHIDDTGIKAKRKVLLPLITAMFLSPCFEIEAYFLLAGSEGWHLVVLIALIYLVLTLGGMLIWVRFIYQRIIKFNWHFLDHYAGIITGWTLIITGVLTYFIH